MASYCDSDVKLLKAGCQKSQEEFETKAEFNPFVKCVTIASACHRFWRKKLVPLDTVASEPCQGWRGAQSNQSLKALKWMAWQEHRLRLDMPSTSSAIPQTERIRHMRNGGEQRLLGKYLVDGYDANARIVYEFQGCLWHECPRCFPKQRHRYTKMHPDRTLQQMYEATKHKHGALREHGFRLVITWECDWDQDEKTNESLQTCLKTLEWVEPLPPRDAFFGGRTNAVKLHHEANTEAGEQTKYLDVTSLYPWVNKTGTFPVGHPVILPHPEGRLDDKFWSGQGGHLATLRVVPSRVTPSVQWQIDLSAMCHVRPRGNAPDPVGSSPGLPSHRRTTHLAWDVVHARTSKSRGEGIHHHQDP